ncbi:MULTISPECIES: MarR family winged helix-turn-helix transcriptional regulator [unclassified Streptomyces]|uniref:MarR family winged helix-turn-helix transcriptional regulator n=1 Tax=unclassified Streptomyces TaxID=2593676 RepID=UPI0006AF9F24|nr:MULTISPECIES: MarR family transcriptional regulator [unclassified Streptomyces]KOX25084.1 MarR family transcriptional regulator [Streptomyces sp. NRRL F-6491]KOX37045.1 MarR family transcriptional regulator [Streptomyces sp. NRRL F-6492]
MEEAVRDGVAEQRERLMESLRTYGGHYAELSRRFAAWLGLHSTDATAVLEIAAAEERGTPLSPARLSERISLSTGATTALLNRLEAAGHITRAREHSDRRIVTLRSGGHIQERADEFFGPLAHRLDTAMSHYPPQLLKRFEAFVDDLNATMDVHLEERNTTPPSSSGPPGDRPH